MNGIRPCPSLVLSGFHLPLTFAVFSNGSAGLRQGVVERGEDPADLTAANVTIFCAAGGHWI